ncbi:hypothetical protein CH249_14410 [Rhodococcus sp. 05-2255-3B1]|uniref:hypothetical protein n=1 Tax=unclassified Rhodococcus (in: high G+C Gram-positive bacteria) TaxID=192944 RepID=UPI000B9A57AF|nr:MULTISPECIES: hypothetical protein [unclassified Rhodococcus (in: high G+C Gram-positive bacteria)]OZE08598.1 hypothetical protein CH250_17035 [Rhodococcus sp. 05-2255-3C]OZE10092.1 hypothetical protein CH249_14410 [Rhodococcus sp. 05-2255-3B1]OZE17236.1 hypothetical protein CH255_18675 [Rhodococcus sp. 05-2255-2A2]
MKALRCHIGVHSWTVREVRPATWTINRSTTDTDVHYRRCGRCGQWQREVFRSGRFADVDQPYDSEPDLGSPYFD